MEKGSHHYILCLDPEDTEASKFALEYTKARLAHAGDLVVLFSVLDRSLYFPREDWSAPHFLASVCLAVDLHTARPLTPSRNRNFAPTVDKEAVAKLEAQLKEAETARLDKAAEGFPEGVRVRSVVEFSGDGPKIEKIVEACQANSCEIIIVGRRKQHSLQRWLGAGSVSTSLLTNTDYSVLVVR
ncbi:hypothetical protein RQP46_005372 [Phenoliferia psychrophenolica]